MPTPAVAYLTRTFRAEAAGIVIRLRITRSMITALNSSLSTVRNCLVDVEEAIEAEMEKRDHLRRPRRAGG